VGPTEQADFFKVGDPKRRELLSSLFLSLSETGKVMDRSADSGTKR
jgi:hypothetical protein